MIINTFTCLLNTRGFRYGIKLVIVDLHCNFCCLIKQWNLKFTQLYVVIIIHGMISHIVQSFIRKLFFFGENSSFREFLHGNFFLFCCWKDAQMFVFCCWNYLKFYMEAYITKFHNFFRQHLKFKKFSFLYEPYVLWRILTHFSLTKYHTIWLKGIIKLGRTSQQYGSFVP